MKQSKKKRFSNWSGISASPDQAITPDSISRLDKIFEFNSSFAIRGMGKNYTDAGLHSKNILLNDELNQILSFDSVSGNICVQPGVVLHDLLTWVIPKGWILPTIPGTAYVSMGGMLASNVHGKNQYQAGSVGDYVQSFVLRTPLNEKVVCTPMQNRDLFDATIGGMGTTGFIEQIELKLKKINTPYLKTNYIKTRKLKDQIEIMESKRSASDFTIGWLDHHSLQNDKINGLIEYASYCDPQEVREKMIECSLRSIPVLCYAPVSMVNQVTSYIFNKLAYAKSYPSNVPIHFYEFNFKLDKLMHWNRLYGKKGLIQYQCLIPKNDQTIENIQYVLSYLKKNDIMSSLVVIKMHKTDPFGHFSFSRDGMSVAMDFPCTEKALQVLHDLNPWVIDIGGRVYLTKDRTMDHMQFRKMYTKAWFEQKTILSKIDPHRKMQSMFSQRLKLGE